MGIIMPCIICKHGHVYTQIGLHACKMIEFPHTRYILTGWGYVEIKWGYIMTSTLQSLNSLTPNFFNTYIQPLLHNQHINDTGTCYIYGWINLSFTHKLLVCRLQSVHLAQGVVHTSCGRTAWVVVKGCFLFRVVRHPADHWTGHGCSC